MIVHSSFFVVLYFNISFCALIFHLHVCTSLFFLLSSRLVSCLAHTRVFRLFPLERGLFQTGLDWFGTVNKWSKLRTKTVPDHSLASPVTGLSFCCHAVGVALLYHPHGTMQFDTTLPCTPLYTYCWSSQRITLTHHDITSQTHTSK